MEIFYIGILFFLFLLAIMDLMVGVSNDAVNFLNSSIGCKAAKFKVIVTVAAIGVFIGAAFSNGMMDIARHGIMQPTHFSFNEVMCIFLAVMVTDVILLDLFNTLGMPTSTTVSMVFELLGGTFIIALVKMWNDPTDSLGIGNLLNTDKALSVILGIFLSVFIAFIVGTVIQFITRTIFTFNYRPRLKYLAGIFGGLAVTSILNFLLTKGLKNATFMTPEIHEWMGANSWLLLGGMFVVTATLMQILHWLKVDIMKIIVLLGTFSLAIAFAGNDLVNFIGVPLAGYSSFMDYITNGSGDPNSFMMSSLSESAKTPIYFLIGAGAIMVFALITSKKAHNVVKTELGLSKQNEGDEMFGSSAAARNIVRWTSQISNLLHKILPESWFKWLDKRFDTTQMDLEEGAVYDNIRASVNLVLSSLLIVLGTSYKLPLSTTYVTFIVAMGTSLSDRAWGRESAVFRITGMLSVIGGWFMTAAIAFTSCAIIAISMLFGGKVVMILFIALTIVLLIRSQISYSRKQKNQSSEDELFEQIIRSKDKNETLELLKAHSRKTNCDLLQYASEAYKRITDGLFEENLKMLKTESKNLINQSKEEKRIRRRELIGLRKTEESTALIKSTWFHLNNNCNKQLLYRLKGICDPSTEHIDNHFAPLCEEYKNEFIPLRDQVAEQLDKSEDLIRANDYREADALIAQGESLKDKLSNLRHEQEKRIQTTEDMRGALLYLNLLQETQELSDAARHQLRACKRFQQ